MIEPVDTDIYENDELKHYRTPGSKNGVRLYQHLDGSLTALGEMRYLKGEKNGNKHYYETGYKPGFLDVYGKRKQNELKKNIKNNGGNKNYKGYQRAEDKEFKYQDPKKKRFEMHLKIQSDKPNARRQRVIDLNKAEEQIQKNYERDQQFWLTRESSDNFINKKRRSLISGILSNDKYRNTGKNFIISIAKDPSIFGLVKYFINNNQKSNSIDNNFQNQEIHDEHANSYEAWAHIGKKRIKDLFSAGKDRLKREKKENERSVDLLGLGKMHWDPHIDSYNNQKSNKPELGKMHWDPHIDSYKNKKRSNNFRISKNELKK